mgnify:CR=1 FL=1
MYYETIQIDFNSDEAIYIQLRNQIILGIATSRIQEGDTLPSVRQLADNIGINMHTVNKAYSVLRQEGLLSIDRRKGAVIRIDADKLYVCYAGTARRSAGDSCKSRLQKYIKRRSTSACR